jgi:hypothetical protein
MLVTAAAIRQQALVLDGELGCERRNWSLAIIRVGIADESSCGKPGTKAMERGV